MDSKVSRKHLKLGRRISCPYRDGDKADLVESIASHRSLCIRSVRKVGKILYKRELHLSALDRRGKQIVLDKTACNNRERLM